LTRAYFDPRTDAPVTGAKTGDTVRVRVTVQSPETRHHVAITDYLPAGLEPIQTKFVTSAVEPDKTKGSYSAYWISNKEIHDDRVDVFADYLWSGEHSFSYLARATTSGNFVVAGARAELMYDPDVHATLAPSRFEVRAP
jgi:uncharacterized protein YfaS (alpha-2-macroglobulin family)